MNFRDEAVGNGMTNLVLIISMLLFSGCITSLEKLSQIESTVKNQEDANRLESKDEWQINSLLLKPKSNKQGFTKNGKGEVEKVSYVEYEPGLGIIDGDMIIPVTKNENEAALLTPACSMPSCRWDNYKYIPYEIDPTVSQIVRDSINRAIAYWNSRMIIPYQQRITENDFVKFTKGNGCSSNVGRIGGQQVVVAGDECQWGNILHEMGHTFGFYHLHQSLGAQVYLNINSDNIQKNHVLDFKALGAHIYYFASRPPDYDSLMIYDSWAWAIDNSKPTMTRKYPRSGENQTWKSQRDHFSALDLLGAKLWYNKYQCKKVDCEDSFQAGH